MLDNINLSIAFIKNLTIDFLFFYLGKVCGGNIILIRKYLLFFKYQLTTMIWYFSSMKKWHL